MIIDSLENKKRVLEKFLALAGDEGWNLSTIKNACTACNIEDKFSTIIFEEGVSELTKFYVSSYNQEFLENFQKWLNTQDQGLKIRDKIRFALYQRFEIEYNNRSAIKRLLQENFRLDFIDKNTFSKSFLYQKLTSFGNKIINNSADSNSFNDKLSSILSAYQIADCVWLAIQDKSSDMSYYSKRLILSKIIIKTIKIFITDDNLDISKTKKFIDQEIKKVMAFENLKKQSKEKINLIVNKIKNNSHIADINEEKHQSINNAVKKISDFINKLPFFRLRK